MFFIPSYLGIDDSVVLAIAAGWIHLSDAHLVDDDDIRDKWRQWVNQRRGIEAAEIRDWKDILIYVLTSGFDIGVEVQNLWKEGCPSLMIDIPENTRGMVLLFYY